MLVISNPTKPKKEIQPLTNIAYIKSVGAIPCNRPNFNANGRKHGFAPTNSNTKYGWKAGWG